MTDDSRRTPDELRAMSLGGLLDEWDEPMSAEQRADLLAELEARGYRTSSLEAPPELGSMGAGASSPTANPGEAHRARRVRNGSMIVLLVGVLTLLGAAIAAFTGNEAFQAREKTLAAYAPGDAVTVDGERHTAEELRTELKVERAVVLYIPFALAGAFLGLYLWSRSTPRYALPAALVLYVGLQVLRFAAGPEVRPARLAVPIFFTIGLALAVVAAWRAPKPEVIDGDEYWEGV